MTYSTCDDHLVDHLVDQCDYAFWFVLLVSFIIVIIIIPRFFFYTPHGDINNFYAEKVSCKKSDEELIETLYELSVYDYCKVRWHYTFLLSLTASIIILYLINCVSLANIIIATVILFIAIEIPGRLENGHIKNATANKASIVYGVLLDRLGSSGNPNNNSSSFSNNSK